MPPSRLARLAVTTVACVALSLGTAGSASAAQTVALLTPADGSAITLKPNTYVTYRWLVSWPEAPRKGTVAITWQLSTDPAFSTIVGTEVHMCPARSYNCWTAFTPARAYGAQTFYWRVKFGDVYSDVSSFTVKIPDRVKPKVRALSGSARPRKARALRRAGGRRSRRGPLPRDAALARRVHGARAVVPVRPVGVGQAAPLQQRPARSRSSCAQVGTSSA